MIQRAFLVGMTMLMATSAMAQSEAAAEPPERIVYRKATTLDFTNAYLEGTLSRPEGAYMISRTKTRFRNLIEMRGHFRPELEQSSNRL